MGSAADDRDGRRVESACADRQPATDRTVDESNAGHADAESGPTSADADSEPTSADAESKSASADADPQPVRTDGGSESALLYGGEKVRARLSIPGGQLLATSHRLLVVTPDGDGPNLRVVHRPNVDGLSREVGGRQFLKPLAVSLAGGLFAVVVGSLVSVEGMGDAVPTDSPVGGLLGPVATVLNLFGLIDELLVGIGLLGLLAGVVIATVWLSAREAVVTVRVAGDDSVRVPAGGVTARQVRAFAADAGFTFEDGLL